MSIINSYYGVLNKYLFKETTLDINNILKQKYIRLFNRRILMSPYWAYKKYLIWTQ